MEADIGPGFAETLAQTEQQEEAAGVGGGPTVAVDLASESDQDGEEETQEGALVPYVPPGQRQQQQQQPQAQQTQVHLTAQPNVLLALEDAPGNPPLSAAGAAALQRYAHFMKQQKKLRTQGQDQDTGAKAVEEVPTPAEATTPDSTASVATLVGTPVATQTSPVPTLAGSTAKSATADAEGGGGEDEQEEEATQAQSPKSKPKRKRKTSSPQALLYK